MMPVPMAVPPRFTSVSSSGARRRRRSRSSPRVVAKAWNSWPRVIGTASCNWVRPIFSTPANSTPLAAKAWIRLSRLASRVSWPSSRPRRMAVG